MKVLSKAPITLCAEVSRLTMETDDGPLTVVLSAWMDSNAGKWLGYCVGTTEQPEMNFSKQLQYLLGEVPIGSVRVNDKGFAETLAHVPALKGTPIVSDSLPASDVILASSMHDFMVNEYMVYEATGRHLQYEWHWLKHFAEDRQRREWWAVAVPGEGPAVLVTARTHGKLLSVTIGIAPKPDESLNEWHEKSLVVTSSTRHIAIRGTVSNPDQAMALVIGLRTLRLVYYWNPRIKRMSQTGSMDDLLNESIKFIAFPDRTSLQTWLEARKPSAPRRPPGASGTLIIKVRFEKLSRTIELTPRHTFHDLHREIQAAFGWGDDYRYSFFMAEKQSSHARPRFGSRRNDNRECADEITLAEAPVPRSGTFWYLSDQFGDELWHECKLIGRGEKKARVKYPRILESKGRNIPQYRL